MAGSLSCCYQYADHAMLLMLMMCMANMLDVFGEQLLFGAITHHSSIISISTGAGDSTGPGLVGARKRAEHQHIYVLVCVRARSANTCARLRRTQYAHAHRAIVYIRHTRLRPAYVVYI